jgi:hypothetical protein
VSNEFLHDIICPVTIVCPVTSKVCRRVMLWYTSTGHAFLIVHSVVQGEHDPRAHLLVVEVVAHQQRVLADLAQVREDVVDALTAELADHYGCLVLALGLDAAHGRCAAAVV